MQRLSALVQEDEDPRASFAQEEEKPRGFFSNVARSIVGSGAKLAATAGAAVSVGTPAAKALYYKATGNKAKEEENVAKANERIRKVEQGTNVPIIGNVKPIASAKEAVGVGADIAANFIPGVKGATALTRVGLNSAKGAVQGAFASGGQALQEGKSLKEAGRDALIGAGTGAVTSGVISGLGEGVSKLSRPLKESAVNTYTKALAPTTKVNKEIAAKSVPELLGRKVFAFSRSGLKDKIGKSVDTAADALEQGYDALPKDAKVNLTPVLAGLEEIKQALSVNGVVLDPKKYKALTEVQKDLLAVAGGTAKKSPTVPTVDVASARKARQILDSVVKRSGKGFAISDTDSAVLEAKKAGVNALRNELAKQHPSIAVLNKEFNFWKNVDDVLDATIKRTTGQNPLSETIAESAGAVTGAVARGTLGSILLTATGAKMIKQAVQSTAWRTTSAVVKNQLAEALANQDDKAVMQILRQIAAPLAAKRATGSTAQPE